MVMRKIKLNRGKLANLPQLEIGEPAVATDDGSLHIGTEQGNVKLAKDADVQAVSQQLADTSTKLTSNVTYKDNTIRPVITFIDDDANADVWSKLKPWSDTYGFPFGLAVATGWINNPGRSSLTESQLKTLYNVYGYEMLGHGVDYAANLTEFTVDADLDYQLGEGCKGWLEGRGFVVNGFVFPQGKSDARIRRHTSKFYDFSFGANGLNGSRLDSMNIARIAFGSWTDQNPKVNGNNEQNTLAYYKACVDWAIQNNEWVIFMTHCHEHDDAIQQQLYDLGEYIKSQGVEVLTPTEAYKIHGNKVFAGDVQEGKYFTINKHGETYNSDFKQINLPINSVLTTTPISYYQQGVTYCEIGTGNEELFAFPGGEKGILVTTKVLTNGIASYQEYYPRDTQKIWRRYWDRAALKWSSWHRVTDDFDYKQIMWPINTAKNSTPPSSFDIGITFCEIGTGNAELSSFPYGEKGLLITTKFLSNDVGTYQEYQVRGSHRQWRRYWDWSNLVWSGWLAVFTDAGQTASRPSNPIVGYPYFDINLDRPTWFRNNGTWLETIGMFKVFSEGRPTSPTAPGVKGDFCADANYLYVCYNTNQWIRIAKDSTW